MRIIIATLLAVLTLNLAADQSARPQPTAAQPTIAESIRADHAPSDIAAIAKEFDALVREIGFAATVTGVREANDLTGEEMAVLLRWMDDALPSAAVGRVLRYHQACDCAALRGCWQATRDAATAGNE